MTHSKQSAKRVRQNEKRRQRNKARTSAVRTQIKKIMEIAAAGDQAKAKQLLPDTISKIDKSAKGPLHKNTAARRKSRLMRAVAKAGTKAKAK